MNPSKLRPLREEHHLTQQQLANALHMSQNAYSLLENGKTKLDQQRLQQLSDYFNIQVHEFFDCRELPADIPVSIYPAHPAENMPPVYTELIHTLREELQSKNKKIEQLLQVIQQLKNG